MVDLLYHLISLLFFIIIYYYYINLRSLIISYFCSGDVCFSLCIFLLCSIFSSNLFCGEVFETLVLLPAILFPIITPVASVVYLIVLFEAKCDVDFISYL